MPHYNEGKYLCHSNTNPHLSLVIVMKMGGECLLGTLENWFLESHFSPHNHAQLIVSWDARAAQATQGTFGNLILSPLNNPAQRIFSQAVST